MEIFKDSQLFLGFINNKASPNHHLRVFGETGSKVPADNQMNVQVSCPNEIVFIYNNSNYTHIFSHQKIFPLLTYNVL